MGRFSGPGGTLSAVAEPFRFSGAALQDRGDGWSWRIAAPALRQWEEEPLVEGHFEYGWEPLAMTWQPLVGVVDVSRCLRGASLRCSGVARPLAVLAEAASWELEIEVAFATPGALGDEYRVESRYVGAAVVLHGCPYLPEPGPVRVDLPFAGGLFVGFGEMKPLGAIATVTLDERGATYGPA